MQEPSIASSSLICSVSKTTDGSKGIQPPAQPKNIALIVFLKWQCLIKSPKVVPNCS